MDSFGSFTSALYDDGKVYNERLTSLAEVKFLAQKALRIKSLRQLIFRRIFFVGGPYNSFLSACAAMLKKAASMIM